MSSSMRRKSRAVALLVPVMALGMTSCGGSDSTGGDGDSEVVKVGLSAPASGAAAGWGIGAEYAAEQAAEDLNDGGGIEVGDQRCTFEVLFYDNEYEAATGAEVAQTLLNRDNVDYIASSVGTAPMQALQSMTEPAEMVHFTTAWGPEVKGPDFPYTFTSINTPFELLEPLYGLVVERHPQAKTVTIVNPNDATGQQTQEVAQEVWEELGMEVLSSGFYERGTTQFAGQATAIIREGADLLDMGTMPAGEAGLLMRALVDQGWDGIRVNAVGTSGADLVEAGGDAVQGTYMGLAADYEGADATDVQQRLAGGLREETGETLNTISMGAYDAMMAYAAAAEEAGTCSDQAAIRDALPEVVVDSSYGEAAFGGEEIYGTPQQLLLPVIVSQVEGGETVQLETLIPEELETRLNDLGD